MILGDRTNRMASDGNNLFKFLTDQLPTIGFRRTGAVKGNKELGLDFEEGSATRPQFNHH